LLLSFAASAFAVVAHADEGPEFWFNDGLAWYQHPCGWDAFVKYGKQDTPQIRHNYYLTMKQPELCSKLFPS
jgi:hypothetical protein